MSWRARWGALSAYDIHKLFVNEYILTNKNATSVLKRDTSKDKRDIDVIRENHQFLWDEETDPVDTWEKKVAKKYYDRLFKEYCIGDLSHYKEDKFGFRWRIESEVIAGKGQFICGEKRCDVKEDLRTWEVNFGYNEHGVKKNALVKLRLCPKCSKKLNYRFKRKEHKRLKSAIKSNKTEINAQATSSSCVEKSADTDQNSEAWQQTTEKHERSEEQDLDDFLQDLFLLICMSLKDALNQGVGGVSLSEEDFQNVATRLLSFDDAPSKVIVAATVADDDSVLQVSDNDSLLHLKPTRTVLQSRRTLLKAKSSTKTLSDLERPSTSKTLDRKATDSDDLDSVLVSDSGLSSDTSEAVSLSNLSTDSTPPKRRGGWPKGRKRKPENKSEMRQPKAPATGYVLFLNERRKDYKDLRFSEVTKLLGHEWSRLSFVEKRRYLEQAEVEKKRYREELKSYRQSDAYRVYLQRKRAKRLTGLGAEESDMDATDEIDDDDDAESDMLYCRVCDQWFHSLHNKKEHMYGRQHLASIANRGKEDWIASTSLDESSLDGIRDDAFNPKEPRTTSISMDDAIVRFTATNLQREREVSFLRQKLHEADNRNLNLTTKMAELKRKLEDATKLKRSEDKVQGVLEQRIINLLGVYTFIEHNT